MGLCYKGHHYLNFRVMDTLSREATRFQNCFGSLMKRDLLWKETIFVPPLSFQYRLLFRGDLTLRKHAYSNILKILLPENENFQLKNSNIFHISAQNIDCRYSLKPPRRGGSNEYPQSMFLRRNKKNNVYPGKPQFYYIKVEFKGSKLYRYVFVMMSRNANRKSQKKSPLYKWRKNPPSVLNLARLIG